MKLKMLPDGRALLMPNLQFCIVLGRSAALASALFAMSLIAPAQTPGASAESARIVALEAAWNDAEVNRDAKSLDLLLADRFVNTGDDGLFQDKKSWLAKIRDQSDQFLQLANSGIAVSIYENTAVVTGEYKEKVKIKGKIVQRSGRFTDTWVRRDGEWKCVASQSTLIDPRNSP